MKVLFQAFVSDYEDSIPRLAVQGQCKKPIERIQVFCLHEGLKVRIHYRFIGEQFPDGYKVEVKEYFYPNRININKSIRMQKALRRK